MSHLLTSNGNLSLPYRMSSIHENFRKVELTYTSNAQKNETRIIKILPSLLIKQTLIHFPGEELFLVL